MTIYESESRHNVRVYSNLKLTLKSQQIVKSGNKYDDETLLNTLRPDIDLRCEVFRYS